jgi:hypothetical protein
LVIVEAQLKVEKDLTAFAKHPTQGQASCQRLMICQYRGNLIDYLIGSAYIINCHFYIANFNYDWWSG